MKITDDFFRFIHRYAAEDTDRLLFTASRYPEVDVPFAVDQILIRRQVADKLPTWCACGETIFPSRMAAEQCSSEATAQYKTRLLDGERSLCDLTGGMGVDTWAFAKEIADVTYVERQESYCEAARWNFDRLGAAPIAVCCDAGESFIRRHGAELFYIDPARRKNDGARAFALTDCTPDLVALLPELLHHTTRVIAKLSPMLDLRHTLQSLAQVSEVHVVSVKNECKELLVKIDGRQSGPPLIHCVNLPDNVGASSFVFTLEEEMQAPLQIADGVATYLYEPNASVMKAGAYKLVAARYGLEKLHVNSHLYTSNRLRDDFPGRIFRVCTVEEFSSRWCKTASRQWPKANIAVRNFLLPADELRRRTRIADGGDLYLFATTLGGDKRTIISCERYTPVVPPASITSPSASVNRASLSTK